MAEHRKTLSEGVYGHRRNKQGSTFNRTEAIEHRDEDDDAKLGGGGRGGP